MGNRRQNEAAIRLISHTQATIDECGAGNRGVVDHIVVAPIGIEHTRLGIVPKHRPRHGHKTRFGTATCLPRSRHPIIGLYRGGGEQHGDVADMPPERQNPRQSHDRVGHNPVVLPIWLSPTG